MKYHTQKGFVVLFTILISSIVLLMALGITSIATKEVSLSIQSRDAAKAFFAADAGMECALYEDRIALTFPPGGGTPILFNCNGTLVEPAPLMLNSEYAFYASVGVGNCVRVDVDKNYNGGTQTRITALGYNTAFGSDGTQTCGENSQNPRRIERGYRATY
jgi:hypothetical protein